MARTKGTYSLPANVEVLAGAPLDARDRVATKADLTTSGTFPYPYVGMETFVVSEGKKYRLIGENPTVLDNWEELGSGILEGAKTVTGNPITLADGSDSYAEDLSVIIEPAQDLHGYDHPWVGGAGKNKLHVTMDSSTIGTFSMVVNSDGSVTFDGTAQSEIQNILADEYPTSNITIPSGTYKLNGGVAGVTILVYADNALIYMGSATSDAEFTIPSGISSSYVSIDIASGSIFSNVTMYPMVRLSTVTDGTFEPWANVCPITGYTEVEVEDCGKNIATTEIYKNNYVLASDGSESYASGFIITKEIRINSSNNYYLSMVGGQTSSSDAIRIGYYDGDFNFIRRDEKSSPSLLSIPDNAEYIRLSYRDISPYFKDIQIEVGTEATSYEPYQSQSVTLQFGQTVYGGRSNFTDGGTTDDRAYGTVTITSIYDASNINVDFAVFSVSDVWAQVGYLPKEFISNMAILSDQTFGTETKVSRVHVYSTNNKQLAVSVPKGSTLSDAQTLFSGMTYCYKKATPTTIDTPTTDLKLLKGTNNLTSNGTTINLKYWPNTVLGDVLAASEAYTDRNKGEGGGAGAVKGYYKTADGKFYEESTYTTEITPDASLLYLDLSTENIYDCDGTNYTLVTTDEKVTAETKDPTDATWYGITFVNRTITNQKPYVNSGLSHYTKKGTTTDKGISMFQIGNDISIGTTDNKYGVLRLQSEKSGCADIKATAESTSIRTFILPDKSGTVTSDITDEKVTGQVQNPTSDKSYFVSFIESSGNQKPYINNGIRYSTKEGTASAMGYGELTLGNSTGTGTAENKRGSIAFYSEKSGYVRLLASPNSTTGRAITFPDKAGTVALTSDITDTAVTITATTPSTATAYYPVWHTATSGTSVGLKANDGFSYISLQGTTSAAGYGQLLAGNNVSTGTAGNKYGVITIYSEKNGYVSLRATASSTTNRTLTLPDNTGTVALTSDLSSYLQLSGGTMTGALNFKNGTANKVGDDVQIGDYNKAGSLGVQGLNGSTSIKLIKNGASWASASEGGMILYNSTSKSLDFIFE